MYQSLKFLFRSPYNKKHPFFAILRFVEWKIIKLFKLTNYKKRVWGNRYLLLNHDSFQSMWVMYNWVVDWEEFNLIRDLVKEKDHCLDIGSNMGFYTIWFSKFTRKILCFEPDEKNFDRLTRNIKINVLDKDILPFNMALGEQEGLVRFTNDLDGENHINLSEDKTARQVKCRRLENVLRENDISQVKYMKIDVEGFELSVLKGMADLLDQKKVDVIQIEVNQAIVNSGSTTGELLEFIKSHGYALCSYDVNARQLKNELYHANRENYFLTYDIETVNHSLSWN